MNTLILIPGHNEKERGYAVEFEGKEISEHEYTLSLSGLIKDKLELEKNLNAEIFTRIDHSSYTKECIDLSNRVNLFTSTIEGNYISLELHFNDLGNPTYRGVESFVDGSIPQKKLTMEFKSLYHRINADLSKLLDTRNRCFKKQSFFKKKSKEERGSGILSRIEGDRVLVELFNGGNFHDLKAGVEKKEQIAITIIDAIKQYFDVG